MVEWILTACFAIVSGLVAFIMKTMLSRLESVEQKADQAVTSHELRQILADKLEPMHADMKEVKDGLRQLFQLYITEVKSKNNE